MAQCKKKWEGMENKFISNNSYIRRTNKGARALVMNPPIPFKHRTYLKSIPEVSENEEYTEANLLKVHELYSLMKEREYKDTDPIEFTNLINDFAEKGWIVNVSESEILERREKIEEDRKKTEEVEILSINESVNNDTDISTSSESEAETPKIEEAEAAVDKWLDDHVEEEMTQQEKIQKKLAEEREKLKLRKMKMEQESLEIPWNSPYDNLDDLLTGKRKESRNPLSDDASVNVKSPILKDIEDAWIEQAPTGSSTLTKSQEEKYNRQIEKLKKDRKTGKTSMSTTSSGSSKKKTEEKADGGFFDTLKSFFKK